MKQKFICILLLGSFLLLSGCANRNPDMESEKDNGGIMYDVETEYEIMVFLMDFDGYDIYGDAIEWVLVPSERADELGIEYGPSGFYIYNPETVIEHFTLSPDCAITILDHNDSYMPIQVSIEELFTVLEERRELSEISYYIPYTFVITNGEITELTEQYTP